MNDSQSLIIHSIGLWTSGIYYKCGMSSWDLKMMGKKTGRRCGDQNLSLVGNWSWGEGVNVICDMMSQ